MKNGNGKTAQKTATSPISGAEIPLGNHPGNTGGKKGRSGRRPLEITLLAQRIFSKKKLLEVVAMIATADIGEIVGHDKAGEPIYSETKNADRLAAIRFIASYAYGQPSQRVEHTGEDGGPIEFVTEARETFAGRMDSLIARVGANRFSGLAN